MSNQDKSKKELTEKELKQAAGGADIDGGGAVAGDNTSHSVIAEAGGWYDPQGDWHPGPNPNVTAGDVAPYPDDPQQKEF